MLLAGVWKCPPTTQDPQHIEDGQRGVTMTYVTLKQLVTSKERVYPRPSTQLKVVFNSL